MKIAYTVAARYFPHRQTHTWERGRVRLEEVSEAEDLVSPVMILLMFLFPISVG